MAKEIPEHAYHVVSKVTVTYTIDSYVVATNKEKAEDEAVICIHEEYGTGSEIEIEETKIHERNVGLDIIED